MWDKTVHVHFLSPVSSFHTIFLLYISVFIFGSFSLGVKHMIGNISAVKIQCFLTEPFRRVTLSKKMHRTKHGGVFL